MEAEGKSNNLRALVKPIRNNRRSNPLNLYHVLFRGDLLTGMVVTLRLPDIDSTVARRYQRET